MYFALLCWAVFPLRQQNLALRSLRFGAHQGSGSICFFSLYFCLRNVFPQLPEATHPKMDYSMLLPCGAWLGRGEAAGIYSSLASSSANRGCASGCHPGLSADELKPQQPVPVGPWPSQLISSISTASPELGAAGCLFTARSHTENKGSRSTRSALEQKDLRIWLFELGLSLAGTNEQKALLDTSHFNF